MNRPLHILFAGILLIASSLKAHALLFPDSPPGLLPIWMQWAGVAVEWAMAAWLLSGAARAWAHRAALALLGIFIVVAGARLLSGASDCGCFGRVHVHPAWTLTLDFLLFLAFLWTARRSSSQSAPRGPAHHPRSRYLPSRITTATALCLVVPLLIVPARSSDHVTRIIINQPGSLVGKSFPLLPVLSDSDRADLLRGHHAVILFNHDCDHCRQYLTSLALSAQSPEDLKEIRIIDILNDAPIKVGQTVWPFRQIVLPPNARCIADVPLRIVLQNGIVQESALPK